MEVKKIVEGMTAQQVAQVIDDNFKAQNKILEEDIAKQNNVIGVSEYKDFSEAEAVNVGDVRKYNGFLYECVEATTGAFNASKWKKSSFKAETEKKLAELGSEIDKFSNIQLSSKTFIPTTSYTRPTIGVVLDAGVEYIVKVRINSPSGKFVNLKANNGNSGNAVDVLLSGIYKNTGTYEIKYNPSIDVDTWYIDMASDYESTETTAIDITVVRETSAHGIFDEIHSVEEQVKEVKQQLEDMISGIELLSDKHYNPTELVVRPAIGTVLKAGKTYTVQLDYSIETGKFVGIKANDSISGEPVDTVKYGLYNQKGSYEIEYTPSIDVSVWYIYMASNYVYSENSIVSVKVYGEKDEEVEGTVELPKIKRIEATDFDLETSGNKSLSTNYARGKSMTCVDIDANGVFESVQLDYDGYANVTIDSTSIINSYKDGVTIQHGLSLSTAKRIAMSFERKTATTLLVKIIADGEVFVSDSLSFFVFGGAKLTNTGSKTLHISSFSYCPSLIDNDIWFIGDSYVSAADHNRWPYWIEQWGHGDIYIDGLSGGSSVKMYSSLLADLEMYVPKYIVWCLGMNDADSSASINSSWLEIVQKVIETCNHKAITPVLATIPSVPTRNHSFKNDWVRSSGCRYIDFARAVEDTNNIGQWHSGMLSGDGVHPVELGAKALAMQVLIDLVEITTK